MVWWSISFQFLLYPDRVWNITWNIPIFILYNAGIIRQPTNQYSSILYVLPEIYYACTVLLMPYSLINNGQYQLITKQY